MKIEKFEKQLIKIAKKHDSEFRRKHNPPFFPYYRHKDPACNEYINYIFENAHQIDFSIDESKKLFPFLIMPFRHFKGEPKYFLFLYNLVKNNNDKHFIASVFFAIDFMLTKNDLNHIKHIIEYNYPNLDSDSAMHIKSILFESLGKTKTKDAKKILLNYLKSNNQETLSTLSGLKHFKDPDLIPHIKPLTKSENKEIAKKSKKLIEKLEKLKQKKGQKTCIQISNKPNNDYFNIFKEGDKDILAIDLECIDSEETYEDLVKTLLFFSQNDTPIYQITDNFDLEEGGNIIIDYKDEEIEYPLQISSDWMDTNFLSKLIEDLNNKNTTSKNLKIIPSEGQDVLLTYK